MADLNLSLRLKSKFVNHKRQICIQVDRLISTKRLGSKGNSKIAFSTSEISARQGIIPTNQANVHFQAFKWNLTTETITKLENRHAVLARLKEDTQIPAT